MKINSKGFTLIELLIVIAIVGILATIVIPNVSVAINRSKQKSTMNDIKTISTAVADFVTDNGIAPDQDGTYDASTAFYKSISPLYIKSLPIKDQWGNPFRIWTGPNATQYGISSPQADDFLVASFGRDNQQDSFSFDPKSPNAGFYTLKKMSDFNNDLVMWNGSWIHCPGIPTKKSGC